MKGMKFVKRNRKDIMLGVLMAALLLLRRRQSSTLYLRLLVHPSSTLSRLFVSSQVLVLRTLRTLLKALPRQSRKQFPRKKLKRLLNSLRLLAQKLKLSNFISNKKTTTCWSSFFCLYGLVINAD